jgi:gas vesicle protein
MSNNGNSGFDFFKGFLFGGVVGAVIALLYAPKSGKETRDEIRKRSLELRDDAEAKLELAKQQAENYLEEAKKKLEVLRKEIESAVDSIKGKATDLVDEGKGAVGKETSRIKDAIEAGVSAYKEEKAVKSKKNTD